MKNFNSGIIFCITGLSGSGKSTIGEHLKAKLEKEYGKTVIIHGDDIRKIFKFKSYTKNKNQNFKNQTSKSLQEQLEIIENL